MIVADTSVWIDHFRRPKKIMQDLLNEGSVGLHPYVYGELLLGGLPSKGVAAGQLMNLERLAVASPSEAAAFIEWAELAGTGIGYVDTHLLLAVKLYAGALLFTTDKRLHAQAQRLGIAYQQ